MATIPTFEVASGSQPVHSKLEEWRRAVDSFFDVEPLTNEFDAKIRSFFLGNLLIGQAAASAQVFKRTEAVIQRSQVDHMMIQLYLTGGFSGRAEALPLLVEPGDICCFDLAFGLETEATDFSNITMVIPKSALQPLTKGDQFHGLVLKAGETSNYLLGAHIRELLRLCPTIDEGEIEAVNRVTSELVRLCLRMPARKRLAPDAPPGSLVEKIRSFIRNNLEDPALDSKMICKAFAISRATLYRHFEPFGGVASVIRNWRLSNVFSELENRRAEPLHAIARRNGFTSEAACARAFKQRYGLSPSGFRSLRLSPTFHPSRSRLSAVPDSDRSELTRWMEELGRRKADG